jgi:hypothetical protein
VLLSTACDSKGTTVTVSPFLSIVSPQELIMVISIAHLQPIIALIAGILILVIPRLLNIIVAVYLIAAGLLGLGLFK